MAGKALGIAKVLSKEEGCSWVADSLQCVAAVPYQNLDGGTIGFSRFF